LRLYSIAGGNQTVAEELAARVSATKLLNHVVTASAGLLMAGSRLPPTPSVTREDAFDFVVMALPNNYLPDIEFRGIRHTGNSPIVQIESACQPRKSVPGWAG